MNILFVLENYLPHMGGVEVVFKNLCEGLVEMGHHVTVLTHRLEGTEKDEIIGGVRVRRVRSLRSRRLFTFTAIWQAVKLAGRADIVHTTQFNGAPPGWLGARLRGKPVVIHVHEVWIGLWRKVTDMSWLSAKIHDVLERAIYALPYDKYICVSDSTKRRLIEVGIPERKVTRIYNGHTKGFFDPKKWDGKTVRADLGVGKRFMLFAWGRPGVSKGHEYAILAMRRLKETMPDAHLYLMLSNKETYKKRYRFLGDLIKKHHLEDQVTILDSVPYEELGGYLKAADCILIPSLSEGFGYTTVEACEMGVPVVATGNASIPEVISGPHVLVPPRDPLAIARAVVKVRQGKMGDLPPKDFSWKDNIDAHLKLYQELAKL